MAVHACLPRDADSMCASCSCHANLGMNLINYAANIMKVGITVDLNYESIAIMIDS